MIRIIGNNGRTIRQDIETLPFEEITSPAAVEEFVANYHIKTSWEWFGPQLLAYLARYTLVDSMDGMDYLIKNVKGKPREEGLYLLLMSPRSSLTNTRQTDRVMLPYCSLVPLYMAAQKMYNDVPYSKWSNVSKLVDSSLYAAMTSPPHDMDREEILRIREQGLKETENPATAFRLTGVKNTVLGQYGAYARAIIAQIWCAHPTNRHRYMILNCNDWDDIPEPLISTNLLKPTNSGLPW